MAELTSNLEVVLRDCGLGRDACWKHSQSGKWVIYHWACEAIAAKKGITFDAPTVVEADADKKLAVLLITARLGDRVEWSFGEAAPYNTKQTYPFAMAEKRGKDRVILKLVDLHGEAYSEEEADDFKKPEPKVFSPLTKTALEAKMRKFHGELKDCQDADSLAGLQQSYEAEIKQCMEQHDEWWTGTKDWHGIKGSIMARLKQIEDEPKGLNDGG